MILVIDNYDSFTYNLVQYLGELGAKVEVFRNDEISLEGIRRLKPDKILISPGPKAPKDVPETCAIIKEFSGKIPILGVCLGHQAIGYVFGGKIIPAKEIMHGKTSKIFHDGKTIFKGLANPFEAIRYHSLVIERKSLPPILEISAWTEDGEIMGVRHRKFNVEGVQFHPESILTASGKPLLKNFLDELLH